MAQNIKSKLSEGVAQIEKIIEAAQLSPEAKAAWYAYQESRDDQDRFLEQFKYAYENPKEV